MASKFQKFNDLGIKGFRDSGINDLGIKGLRDSGIEEFLDR